MLNSEYKQHYWDKGWVVVEDVFKPQEIDEVCTVALTIAEQELITADAPSYTVDVASNGTFLPRKVDWPFLKHQIFRDFILQDKLVALVKDLIGVQPFLVRDQLFLKPPHFGSAKPYHQDNAHMLCSPADQVIAAWIALDDADEENGCLRYIDGSHRGSLVEHRPVPDASYHLVPVSPQAINLAHESVGCVRKGGVAFHHCLTFHSSHSNRSERWRRGYTSHWIGPNVTSSNDTLLWAYSRTKGGNQVKFQAP